ncbi:hypothetical protein [Methanohalophilus sp.]
MKGKHGFSDSSINKIKEIPWEASLFFMGWIWIGWSVFGMTLVNMYLTGSFLDAYHLIIGIIYLLPMFVIGLKVFKYRNVAGLPLILCSFVIGALAIVSHSNINLGTDAEFNFLQETAVVVLTLLLVATPASFYIYARSIGCYNTRCLKLILAFSAINGLVLIYNELIDPRGVNSELISILMLSFLFVIGPAFGGIYVWEVMSKSS